ncbi:inositol monophosphatase family protein [Fusibacter bizertensis]
MSGSNRLAYDDDFIRKVKCIIVNTADELLSQSYSVKEKGRQDIVTSLDFEMESRIKHELMKNFPEDGFIGEEENHEFENSEQEKHHRTWVLDPIDGTVNFTKGIPYFGVQIALLIAGEPCFSLVYLPKIDEIYHAVSGRGAFLNNEPLCPTKESKQQALKDVIVTFGDFSKSNPSSRGYQLKAMGALADQAMRVRIQGASSIDFAFTAAGRNGCHIMFSKNIWEIAPGLMLTHEAGCVSRRISGLKHGFSGEGIIIAQNTNILEEVLTILEDL